VSKRNAEPRRRADPEAGLALAIALILALTLAVISAAVISSIGTGADVSRNRLWAEMATARAEAGLEYAKTILAAWVAEDGDWSGLLPPPRENIRVASGAPWGAARPEDQAACRDPHRGGCRDYQIFRDESAGGANSRVYIGRVLRTPAGQALFFDPRAPGAGWTPSDAPVELSGVTVWVRRPVVGRADAGEPHDRVVLTAEARYPPPESETAPHAVSRLESTVRLAPRPGEAEETDEYGGPETRFRRVSRPRGNPIRIVR